MCGMINGYYLYMFLFVIHSLNRNLKTSSPRYSRSVKQKNSVLFCFPLT